MSGWVLTKGLQSLRSQVNAAFPDRDKASDGTIGDQAHMAETSGHNPDDTPGSHPEYDDHDGIREVRAWDMDSDLSMHRVTAQMVVDHIRNLPGVGTYLRYMIYDRLIYEASRDWRSRAYTGPSPHTEHIHFSGQRTQAADNNTTFDYRLEDLVALDASDKTYLETTIGPKTDIVPRWTDTGTRVADNDPNPQMQVSEGIFYTGAGVRRVENTVLAMAGVLAQVLANVQTDDADTADLLAAIDAAKQATIAGLLDELGASGRSDEDVAAALRAALGDRAQAVGALLAA